MRRRLILRVNMRGGRRSINSTYASYQSFSWTVQQSNAHNVDVEKSLQANETFSSLFQPDGQDPAVQVPNDIKRRCFTCLSRMLLYIVAHTKTSRVAYNLPPASGGGASPHSTYHWDCEYRPTTAKDHFHISIHSAAKAHRLTWKVLLEEVLLFGASVNLSQPYESIGIVKDRGTVLAAMKLTIRGVRAGDSDVSALLGSATA